MEVKEGTILGQYLLVSKIGEGGWGTVWKAYNVHDGSCVAAKVLKFNSSDKARRARFRNESDVMTRIQSDYVCRAHSRYESADGTVMCYFMEYLEGHTLRDVFELNPTVSVANIKHWIAQLATALRDIHNAELVHRDIKPSNVMVLPDGNIKVFDFGIVKDIAKDPGKTQGNPFTVKYASPEQKSPSAPTIDYRSDYYSLGKLVYFMATGGSDVPDDQPENLEAAIPNYDLRRIVELLTEPDLDLRAENIDTFNHQILPSLQEVETPTAVDIVDDLSDTEPLEADDSPTASDETDDSPTTVDIENAHEATARPWHRRLKWAGMAACIALLVSALSFGAFKLVNGSDKDNKLAVAPNIQQGQQSPLENIPIVVQPGTDNEDAVSVDEVTGKKDVTQTVNNNTETGETITGNGGTGETGGNEGNEGNEDDEDDEFDLPEWWGKNELDLSEYEVDQLNDKIIELSYKSGYRRNQALAFISRHYSHVLYGPQMAILTDFEMSQSRY